MADSQDHFVQDFTNVTAFEALIDELESNFKVLSSTSSKSRIEVDYLNLKLGLEYFEDSCKFQLSFIDRINSTRCSGHSSVLSISVKSSSLTINRSLQKKIESAVIVAMRNSAFINTPVFLFLNGNLYFTSGFLVTSNFHVLTYELFYSKECGKSFDAVLSTLFNGKYYNFLPHLKVSFRYFYSFEFSDRAEISQSIKGYKEPLPSLPFGLKYGQCIKMFEFEAHTDWQQAAEYSLFNEPEKVFCNFLLSTQSLKSRLFITQSLYRFHCGYMVEGGYASNSEIGSNIIDKEDIEICSKCIFQESKTPTDQHTEHEQHYYEVVPNLSLLFRFGLHLLKVLIGQHSTLHEHLIPAANIFFRECWRDFVSIIRHNYWECRKLIPFVIPKGFVDGGYQNLISAQINPAYSILHQKLEMINYCILLEKLSPYKVAEARSCSSFEFSDSDSEVDYFDVKEELPVNGRLDTLGSFISFSSKHQLYVPETQHPGFMTEDMMIDQQQILENLGTNEEAAQLRAKMQSASLFSDMQSFKAANPGCCLADFVRWHSPKDIILSNADSNIEDVTYELSVRMTSGGADNIWQRLWNEAEAVPAKQQKPLFDAEQEGEKALHWLETQSNFNLMKYCLPIVSQISFSLLQSYQEEFKDITLLQSVFAKARDIQCDDFQSFFDIFSEAEMLVSVIKFIQLKFGRNQKLVNWILSSIFEGETDSVKEADDGETKVSLNNIMLREYKMMGFEVILKSFKEADMPEHVAFISSGKNSFFIQTIR